MHFLLFMRRRLRKLHFCAVARVDRTRNEHRELKRIDIANSSSRSGQTEENNAIAIVSRLGALCLVDACISNREWHLLSRDRLSGHVEVVK